MWEETNNINQIAEIRSKTTNYLGVGAINKINDIAAVLKGMGTTKMIVVASKSAYKKTGAWEYVKKAFDHNKIDYVLYDKVTPNPTVHQVDEATKLALDHKATAVLAVGGGSPIDTAKSLAILVNYPDKTASDLMEYRFIPEKAIPLVVVNLTHGTGSEVNRVAVVSIPEKEFKPAIAYDFSYPLYSINDPGLMVDLPEDQTVYVSVDALNHVIEACSTLLASPYSIMMAKETTRLVAKYLPIVKKNPKDLTARYYLTYAAMIAGISFDNAMLHLTHALEHPLSAIKPELAHGLGLALILPAVIKQIYPAACKTLADVLAPIIPDLKGVPEESDSVCSGMKKWLEEMGIEAGLSKLGFVEADSAKIAELAFATPCLGMLLSLSPVKATKEALETIIQDSL
jgi:alcohol dehydrogenase